MTVQEQLSQHFLGMWVLTAVEVASSRGLLEALARGGTVEDLAAATRLSPVVVRGLLDVFAAQGWLEPTEPPRWTEAARGAFAGPSAAVLRTDVRTTALQHAALWKRSREEGDLAGWMADDLDVVKAQAQSSEAVTLAFMERVLGNLPGLADRFAKGGAAMLDVGAGAAGGAIGFARLFPTLRVVGLEPSPVACACAEKAIGEAGLGDRIEMRQQLADALADENQYALAYVAQMFFPEHAWRDAASRVLRALEPGGYLITVATCREGAELPFAVSRLRTATWGGGRRVAEDLVGDLRAAGFAMATAVPGPPGGMVPVFARKA